MATFTFIWDYVKGKFSIARSGQRQARRVASTRQRVGCGASLNWSSMAIVSVPQEFNVVPTAQVDDVASLPANIAPKFERKFDEARGKAIVRDARKEEAAASLSATSLAELQRAAYEMDNFAS